MKTFPIVLREQRYPWLTTLRAREDAPMPMSVFLAVVIGAVESDVEDVVYEQPYDAPDLFGLVRVEDDHFVFEQRGTVYVSGTIARRRSSPWPKLHQLQRVGDAGDYAELDAEYALERGGFHVHPTMLSSALGERGRVVGSVGRVTLGRRCGAWCWIHTNAHRESVVLYDHAAEMVARIEGIATADAFAYDDVRARPSRPHEDVGPRLRRAANG